MKVPTYLHRNSFDIYYFRIAVPAKYRQYIGRSELKKSLHTTSFSVAVRRSHIIAGKAFELFEKAAKMIDDDWNTISSKWTAGLISIDFGNGKRFVAKDLEVDPEKPGDVEGFNETINSLAGKTIVQNADQPAMLFSELFEEYLVARRQRKQNFRNATEKDYRQKIALFVKILGDRPSNYYSHVDADELQGTLQKLPKNWNKSPKYRGFKTIEEVLQQQIPEGDRIADKTINTFMTVISGICRLGLMRGYLKINPFAEKQVILEKSPDEEWNPFTDEDLNKIFDPSTFQLDKRYVSRFFGCLLAIFSGARLNEVSQLVTDNILEYGGYPCVRYTDDGDDQQVKGRNANRTIPLHSKLLQLGFLDYVKTRPKDSMLFPDLTQGPDGKWDRKLRRWFNDTYLKKVNIKRDRLSFRSFRRTFATKLRAAGVEETYAAELLGHAKGKGSFMSWKTYASRGQNPPLIDAIERLDFEWIALLEPWKQ